jgi:hypothetical protein
VTVIPAGSAVGLFPVIGPAGPNLTGTAAAPTGSGTFSDPPRAGNTAAIPSLAPDSGPRTAWRVLGPAADASSSSPGMHVLTAGLVAAALAIMLVTTRLSVRRRCRRAPASRLFRGGNDGPFGLK